MEDEGVLLLPYMNGEDGIEGHTYLVVLDAQTFEEIASVESMEGEEFVMPFGVSWKFRCALSEPMDMWCCPISG